MSAGEGDPWWSSSTGWWQGGWGWRSDRWSSDWWSSDRGKDYSDPPAWAGWSNYRLWRKAVVRWDQATNVQPRRRAERIFKTMDWELQAKFEHIEDVEITGEEYLKHILSILDTLAGESAAVDKRRAVRKALFEGQRKEGETINQFTLRREQEFAMAEKYMPEDYVHGAGSMHLGRCRRSGEGDGGGRRHPPLAFHRTIGKRGSSDQHGFERHRVPQHRH